MGHRDGTLWGPGSGVMGAKGRGSRCGGLIYVPISNEHMLDLDRPDLD